MYQSEGSNDAGLCRPSAHPWTSCIYHETWSNHNTVESECGFYLCVDLKDDLTRREFVYIEGYILDL